MTKIAVSRRNLLATGACALVGAVSLPGPASASALGGQNLTNEEVAGSGYAAWRRKTGPVDSLLADNFTFTSAAGDDHISKSTFKTRCGKHKSISLDILTGANHHWRGRRVCEVSLPHQGR